MHKVIWLHEEGQTPYQIALTLNLTEKTVRNYLASAGLKPNKTIYLSPFLRDFGEMINQYQMEQNYTDIDICKELSISRQVYRGIKLGKTSIGLEQAIRILEKLGIEWKLGELTCI